MGWQAMSWEGAAANVDSAEKWLEKVTPVITQDAQKDIYNMGEIGLFCNAQRGCLL
jgi:hypothetical protein